MTQGKMDGFCRVYKLENEVCLIGFWKPKEKAIETWGSVCGLS